MSLMATATSRESSRAMTHPRRLARSSGSAPFKARQACEAPRHPNLTSGLGALCTRK